jgi:hypothetical protein
VRRGAVEAVVVVPLERGPFRAPVLAQVVDVGFAAAGLEQQVVARLAGGKPAGDAAEGGDRLALGQAAGLAVEAGAVMAAMQVDRELAGVRQLVAEGDPGARPGGPAYGRPREGAAVGPQPGLAAGEDLRLGRADRDLDMGAGQLARDRQPRLERDRGDRLGGLTAERQRQASSSPAGEEVGEAAGAEGAEESSAPQARRGCRRPRRGS